MCGTAIYGMTGGQRFNIEESAKKKWSPGEEIEAVQLIQAHIPRLLLWLVRQISKMGVSFVAVDKNTPSDRLNGASKTPPTFLSAPFLQLRIVLCGFLCFLKW